MALIAAEEGSGAPAGQGAARAIDCSGEFVPGALEPEEAAGPDSAERSPVSPLRNAVRGYCKGENGRPAAERYGELPKPGASRGSVLEPAARPVEPGPPGKAKVDAGEWKADGEG